MDWTSGYRADINYTNGYYNELNPLRLQFALNYAGLNAPIIKTACELGFGQGVSINYHAASSDVSWHGTDFNPSQASHAIHLSQLYQNTVDLRDADFKTFCSDESLPDFDFIALHGIWSWISRENRKYLIDFIKRKLRVGGIAYISYNTYPGAAKSLPLRELLVQVFDLLGEIETPERRIKITLEKVGKIIEAQPKYFYNNQDVIRKFHDLKDKPLSYIAHEYLNKNWEPMSFRTMAEMMSGAKLSFAASANYLDNIDKINFSSSQIKTLSGETNEVLRESLKDIFVNQTFRRDYWVKGKVSFNKQEIIKSASSVPMILKVNPKDFDYKVKGYNGEASLNTEIYEPIINYFSDFEAKTLSEPMQLKGAFKKLSRGQILEAAYVLNGIGLLAPANLSDAVKKYKVCTSNLNKTIAERSIGSLRIPSLASPVTSSGITLGALSQQFVAAMFAGVTEDPKIVDWVFSNLSNAGETVMHEGKKVENPTEAKKVILDNLLLFNSNTLPLLKSLHVL